MMKKYILIIVAVMTIFIDYSCKKTDNPAPVISITSPTQGMVYNILDSIHVVAHVTDNDNINSVKIVLMNSNYTPIDASVTINGTGKVADVDMMYPISSIYLNTGTYYINIQASDGANITNAFQQIVIHGIPLLREAVYTITGSNNANTNVWKIDAGNNISSITALSGDFANAVINSTDHCMYTTGVYSGNFNCINLSLGSVIWNVPAHNTGLPTYEHVFSNNHLNLLADYNNTITGYDLNKTANYTASTISGTYPHIMHADANYLYAEQRDYTGTSIHLKSYFLNTGIGYQELAINEDIVSMFSINRDSLMLFSNTGGTGHAMIYNIPNNLITTPVILPAERLISVTQISPSVYILAMQTKVYIFNTANFGTVTNFINIPASNCMKFDSLNQQLFIANAKTLEVFNYPSNIPSNSLLFTDTLKDICILYNK